MLVMERLAPPLPVLGPLAFALPLPWDDNRRQVDLYLGASRPSTNTNTCDVGQPEEPVLYCSTRTELPSLLLALSLLVRSTHRDGLSIDSIR